MREPSTAVCKQGRNGRAIVLRQRLTFVIITSSTRCCVSSQCPSCFAINSRKKRSISIENFYEIYEISIIDVMQIRAHRWELSDLALMDSGVDGPRWRILLPKREQ